ncbi:MAG: rhomboid family intramembrane serine protease [Calditrichaeota bacterium]|nr:MAG: rhomboid family intramembrane serine protease [Calditrichota bacterium]
MYRTGFGMMSPAVKNLLLANIAVFLVQILWRNIPFELWFGLVPILVVKKLFIWQIVTYMFLHADLGHIFFNMLALWMFGVQLEQNWGTREFLRYYFFTGIVAGVCILLWPFIWGGSPMAPTIGASGAVFGILVAFALFFPDVYIFVNFLFPIKAKYAVVLFILLELYMLPGNDNVSHIAHLGGAVAGYFYIRRRYRYLGIGQNFFRDFFKKKPW